MPLNQTRVGEFQYTTGDVTVASRAGRQGDAMVSDLHGDFYEQTYGGNIYSIGCALTALSAATILLTASAQPIVGLVNPSNSQKNLVLLRSSLKAQVNAVSSVAAGNFVYAVSVGNGLLSLFTAALVPFNNKSLSKAGSVAGAFALSTASLLTGLTTNLAFFRDYPMATPNALDTTTISATTPTPGQAGADLLDGSIIVPPGGVLAILNTVSTVTVSASGSLTWEEVPV